MSEMSEVGAEAVSDRRAARRARLAAAMAALVVEEHTVAEVVQELTGGLVTTAEIVAPATPEPAVEPEPAVIEEVPGDEPVLPE